MVGRDGWLDIRMKPRTYLLEAQHATTKLTSPHSVTGHNCISEYFPIKMDFFYVYQRDTYQQLAHTKLTEEAFISVLAAIHVEKKLEDSK